jgi:hypothetical protein
VSISYLLSYESFNELEDACSYWHKNKALSFHPRIYTNKFGINPQFNFYAKNEKNNARERLKVLDEKYSKGWFVMPEWLKDWVHHASEPSLYSSELTKCYSSLYRIGISPITNGAKPIENGEQKSDFSFTDNAWLNMCLYRRYDTKFGCFYPDDLASWWESDTREKLITKDKLADYCDATICSRYYSNKQIEEALSKNAK